MVHHAILYTVRSFGTFTGVTKMLVHYWFDPQHKGQGYYIGHKVRTISKDVAALSQVGLLVGCLAVMIGYQHSIRFILL